MRYTESYLLKPDNKRYTRTIYFWEVGLEVYYLDVECTEPLISVRFA